ncbi:MAG: hypothetical protein EPO68_04650 [Planctomycetota bacterium]|nr:MAG: hypothetical protein EPO68_04650 [Planctomycetota bacterium]
MSPLHFGSIAALLVACALVAHADLAAALVPGPCARTATADALSADWIVNAGDNVCGLRDTRMLSNPAKIDYDALLAATPEMQKIKRDGIDPSSAEGIQLKQQAIDRVTKACENVRVAQGHCSVWKSISHKDGRAITDITDLVKAKL